MGYPLRVFDPDCIYFVTNRCAQGRLLMTPSPRLNMLIGGVLAQACERYGVTLFAYVFVSNPAVCADIMSLPVRELDTPRYSSRFSSLPSAA